jgi:hypothetical protein
MVAKINREMFADALLAPPSDPSDSDEVLLALDAARALEARGELRGAVRCLRRAADEAEKQGNDHRVLVLARAAADLTNAIGPVSLATSSGSSPSSQTTAVPPMLAALMSSVPLSASRTSAPPPAAAPSIATDKAVVEQTMRVRSVRVAISGSMNESSFVVHRLAPGQPLPEGTTEAMVVLTGDIEGRLEIETNVRVTDLAAAK